MAPKKPLHCGIECWRYTTFPNKAAYSCRVCYVGSSEGATISLGNECVWGYTLKTAIDRGNSAPSSPKCSNQGSESRIPLEVAARNSMSVHNFFHGLTKPSQPPFNGRHK